MYNNNLTESEEMYLVTIRKACEHCTNTPIPIPEIAKNLGVQPVSASQMINKLTDNGFVNYVPYKGVELTEAGKVISTRILRHRRLWEVFLVSILKIELDEADRLACQLEHVTSPDLANRLSEFLDHPTVSFHGDPIPASQDDDGALSLDGVPFDQLKVGQESYIIQIDADQATTKFLADEGIFPGVHICLLAIGSNGDRLLEVQENRIHLSSSLIESIKVSRAGLLKESKKEEQIMTVPLSNLKVGEKGIIHKLNFKSSTRQRMLAMGLVIGETISVKRVAPLGDPIDFVIKGYELSLRKGEASEVLVTPVEEKL